MNYTLRVALVCFMLTNITMTMERPYYRASQVGVVAAAGLAPYLWQGYYEADVQMQSQHKNEDLGKEWKCITYDQKVKLTKQFTQRLELFPGEQEELPDNLKVKPSFALSKRSTNVLFFSSVALAVSCVSGNKEAIKLAGVATLLSTGLVKGARWFENDTDQQAQALKEQIDKYTAKRPDTF